MFPYKLCVTEKRAYVNGGCNLEIPYLLTILLSLPLNELLYFVSRPMAPGLNCVPINNTTPAMNSTNATLLTTLSLDGTIEDLLTTLQMEDSDYTVDGTGATVSPFQGKRSFTNYVYKTGYVGSPKMFTFFNIHTVENVNAGGYVVKKVKILSS